MESPELTERFRSSEVDLDLDGGSLAAVKERAAERSRRKRAAGGAAAVLALALFIVASQVIPQSNETTVDITDVAGVEDTQAAVEGGWTTNGTLTGDDLTYSGSFSVPSGSDGEGFGFGGGSIAYNPAGDGSLFVTGIAPEGQVAEISIPSIEPHEDSRRGFSEAEILQPLTDITSGRGDELIGTTQQGGAEHFQIGGLEVVEGPAGPRLHWTAWRAFAVTNDEVPGHGHSSLDFGDVDVEGPWLLSDFDSFVTAGYVFDVPPAFADSFLDGRQLISGFQLNPGSADTSAGPPFVSFDPPESAAPGTRLDAVALANFEPSVAQSTSFAETAVVPGGEWVTTSDGRHSVVVVGNGMTRDASEGCELGSTTDVAAHDPHIAFYDPADLAATALGTQSPDAVEPELVVSLADVLIPTCGTQLGGLSFDAENRRLFLTQRLVTVNDSGFDARPVIHVFDVR